MGNRFKKNHMNIMILTKMVVNLVKKVNYQKVEKQKNQSQGRFSMECSAQSVLNPFDFHPSGKTDSVIEFLTTKPN